VLWKGVIRLGFGTGLIIQAFLYHAVVIIRVCSLDFSLSASNIDQTPRQDDARKEQALNPETSFSGGRGGHREKQSRL